MANNRFNKQATPKGYKAGGRIKKMGGGMMMQRPMYKDGSKVKKLSKLSGLSEKEVAKKMLSKNKEFKRDGVEFDKPLAPKGTFNTGNPPKRYEVAKGGRIKKKMGGGSLKAVPADKKGLKKLPTEVRNKMGFMKKGGVVSDTKKKQFEANQAGQKATNKKAMKVAQDATGLNLVVGAAEVGKKIARKFGGEK
jgi:hypothetical protein